MQIKRQDAFDKFGAQDFGLTEQHIKARPPPSVYIVRKTPKLRNTDQQQMQEAGQDSPFLWRNLFDAAEDEAHTVYRLGPMATEHFNGYGTLEC